MMVVSRMQAGAREDTVQAHDVCMTPVLLHWRCRHSERSHLVTQWSAQRIVSVAVLSHPICCDTRSTCYQRYWRSAESNCDYNATRAMPNHVDRTWFFTRPYDPSLLLSAS